MQQCCAMMQGGKGCPMHQQMQKQMDICKSGSRPWKARKVRRSKLTGPYTGCRKFCVIASFYKSPKSPFSKGDFQSNSAKFPL